MKTKKTLIISIACGVVAIVLSALYLHLKELEVAGGGELRPVLVAATDIKEHTMMEPGLVRFKKVPVAFIQPGALTNRREIVGRVSIAEIKRGEQIVGSKLVVGGKRGGLSYKISKGERAVSIRLSNAAAAGGLIQPDDYVDVIATFNFGDNDRSDKYTYLLFQNTRVLAVGSKTHSLRNPSGIAVVEKESNPMFGGMPKMSSAASGKKVITFAMGPEDAEKLIFANQSGEITLALRSPTDRSVFDNSRPVKIDMVTGRSGSIYKSYKEYRGR